MSGIPEPTVMPVDRPEWLRRLDLSNFVNAYYEYRDVDSLNGACRVLIVGPGQGLGVQVLRWRGYEVSTLGIDKAFGPDYVGSVYDLSMFGHGQFDVVSPLTSWSTSRYASLTGHCRRSPASAGGP